MNIKKAQLLSFLCILTFLLFVCSTKKNNGTNDNLLNLNIDGVHTFLVFDGQSILYQTLSDNKAVYSRYYIKDEKTLKIGEILNPILIGKSKTLSDNTLYFYATEYANTQKEQTVNNLYEIALGENSLKKIDSNTMSECLIPVDSYNGYLFSLKVEVDRDSGIGSSILESMELKSGETTVILKNTADYVDKQGDAMVNFALANETIYVYSQTANETLISSVKVYDMVGNEKSTLSLATLPKNDLLETSMEIKVFDDIIYLSSISNNVFIGKITDTGFQQLLQGSDIEYAHDYGGQAKVYYKRLTSNIFIYNEQTSRLEEYSINLENDEMIRCMFSNRNDIMLVTLSDNNQEKIYITDIDTLLTDASPR